MKHPICLLTLLATLAYGCEGDSASVPSNPSASPGCQSGDLAAGMSHIDIDQDGMSRSYEIHAPPGYDGSEPVMLLLSFHGFGSTPLLQAERSNMSATADARGFIVAYPSGYRASWNGGECCGDAAAAQIDDVGFARALIDDIGARACIDPKRVYATGMSNGGFMSHRLGCEAADVFAAVAPVAGPLGIDPADCNPSRPIPLLHIHGVDDALAPYENVAPTIDHWTQKNGCTGDPSSEVIGSATCDTSSPCSDGVTVTLCSIENHGHCWPQQETCAFGEVANDFPGNDVMLDFFESIELP